MLILSFDNYDVVFREDPFDHTRADFHIPCNLLERFRLICKYYLLFLL